MTDAQIQPKATIISMINMKGGVGKTTLITNIANHLARNDKKVLLVDTDPQFNATQLLLDYFEDIDNYKNYKTIYDLLLGSGNFTSQDAVKASIQDVIHTFDGTNFSMILGDLRFTDFEISRRGSEFYLSNALDEIATDFDYIFIDTPATYSVYSQSALIASDYYLTPISVDLFASLGYSLLKKKLSQDPLLTRVAPKSLGVIVNQWKERSGRLKILDDLEADYIFDTKITEKEVNRSGSGQTMMSDRSFNGNEIAALVDEILSRITQVDQDD